MDVDKLSILGRKDPLPKYHLEANLSSICMISLAKRLWEIKEIKTYAKNLFLSGEGDCPKGDTRGGKMTKWYKMTKKVLDHAEFVAGKLPAILKRLLDDVIVYIGEEIYSWKEYLVYVLQLDVSFSDVIYLDNFGSIDETQIFQKYWLPNQESLGKNKVLQLACLFAQEEIVFESKNAIIDGMTSLFLKYYSEEKAVKEIEKIKTQISKFEKKSDAVYAVILIWINLNFRKRYLEFDDNLQIVKILDLDTKESISGINECKRDAIMTCLIKHSMLILKYLIKIDFEADDDFLEELMKYTREKSLVKGLLNYERKKCLEIMLLLLNSTSDGRKIRILTKSYKIFLKLTLKFWPYQIFFLTMVFDFTYDFYLIDEDDSRKLLSFIALTDVDDHLCGCPIKRDTNFLIFKKLYTHSYANTVSPYYFNELASIFIKSLNFKSIKLLVDSYPKSWNFYFWTFASEIKVWIKEGNFFLIDKFIEEVFEKSQELKEIIRTNLTVDFISQADFSGVENLLKWSGHKKNEIDGTAAVKLIAKNWMRLNFLYDSANCKYICDQEEQLGNNFLRWLYENDEEKINSVKKCVLNDISFYQDVIFYIICETVKGPNLCTNFLNFIFGPQVDERKVFKRALLKNEHDVLHFALKSDHVFSDKVRMSPFNRSDLQFSYFRIKVLTDFCELTEEEISELKLKCIDNIENIMKNYASNCQYYFILDIFLNWLDENAEPKRKDEFITNFMNTAEGIKLSNVMFTASFGLPSKEMKLKFLFFNDWVKLSKNISKIREQVVKLDKLSDSQKQNLAAKLRKLENGEDLTIDDVGFIYGNGNEGEEVEIDDDYDTLYYTVPGTNDAISKSYRPEEYVKIIERPAYNQIL